jgi:hypothetical protein
MAQSERCCEIKVAQFRKAEKDNEGMAFKIFMGARASLKASIKLLISGEKMLLVR